MTEYTVDVSGEAVETLVESFQQGQVWEIQNGSGLRLLTEGTVARVNGLKVQVFSNEHPPPHFRVQFQNSTANYQISDCQRMNGSGEVLKYEKNILLWWQENKSTLIESWNKQRPSDCPVGEYREP
jgi:Domain of unknown function (DUF4160)